MPQVDNPSAELGSFVNKYHSFIKKALKNDTIDTAVKVVIGDVYLRGQILFKEYSSGFNPQAYAAYRMALSYLSGFINGIAEECKIKPSDVFLNIDRQVADLEFIMSDDPVFEANRKADF